MGHLSHRYVIMKKLDEEVIKVCRGDELREWIGSMIPEFINGRHLALVVTNINGLRGGSKQAEIIDLDAEPLNKDAFLAAIQNSCSESQVTVCAEDALLFALSEGVISGEQVLFYHEW